MLRLSDGRLGGTTKEWTGSGREWFRACETPGLDGACLLACHFVLEPSGR